MVYKYEQMVLREVNIWDTYPGHCHRVHDIRALLVGDNYCSLGSTWKVVGFKPPEGEDRFIGNMSGEVIGREGCVFKKNDPRVIVVPVTMKYIFTENEDGEFVKLDGGGFVRGTNDGQKCYKMQVVGE